MCCCSVRRTGLANGCAITISKILFAQFRASYFGDDFCDSVCRARLTDSIDAGARRREEKTALVLGASGWQTFWHMTLPNIDRVCCMAILCVMRGQWANSARCQWCPATFAAKPTPCLCRSSTYNEYNFVAAFAVASLLTLLALLTLALKTIVEWRTNESRAPISEE